MADTDYGRWWAAGATWDEYLRDQVRTNEALWTGVYARAAVPPWAVQSAARLGGPWKLLVISEDWCGDASNTVPVLARMAEGLPGIEMRIVARDEHPELMDRFLTRGSRSIPVAVVLREDLSLAGWWGPRPAELQAWVLAEKAAGVRPVEEIYRDVRRWYARDRGESTIREVLAVVADAA